MREKMKNIRTLEDQAVRKTEQIRNKKDTEYTQTDIIESNLNILIREKPTVDIFL